MLVGELAACMFKVLEKNNRNEKASADGVSDCTGVPWKRGRMGSESGEDRGGHLATRERILFRAGCCIAGGHMAAVAWLQSPGIQLMSQQNDRMPDAFNMTFGQLHAWGRLL